MSKLRSASKEQAGKERSPPAAASKRGRPAPPRPEFPVVGVGASAGGLEAFEQLFRAAPADSGVAWLLVPHLDPDHASLLSEILQRTTAMPVVEARDRMAVEPDHVYVVPPNREMTMLGGRLRLHTPSVPRGQRMPIDAFFRSLAEDRGELAICIVLSGTGTDGTLGLRAVHGAGGVSFVQEPTSAKFSGMPASAAASGMATFVLPAVEIPSRLVAYVRSRFAVGRGGSEAPAPLPGGLDRLLLLLRSRTGHDFSLYKRSTILRRIERRMAVFGLATIEEYVVRVAEQPEEVQLLFRELLINVTSFFRDPDAFAALAGELPRLLAACSESRPFRVWVPACATGEEAYSIAMLVREQMDAVGHEVKVQIYATDIDDDAIAAARAGFYPPNIAADLHPERLRRYFAKEESGYRIRKLIREMVVFASQNLIRDPPFTRLDLVSCRNVLIYLGPELQNRILPTFHFALRPGGLLMLSPSESVGPHADLFRPIDRKLKLFEVRAVAAVARRTIAESVAWLGELGRRTADAPAPAVNEVGLAELMRRALVGSYAPPSVLIDERGDIQFVHGDTGRYLRPAPGQATLNLLAMAQEGFQVELRRVLSEATAAQREVVSRPIPLAGDGEPRSVSFTVRPLAGWRAKSPLLLVSFEEQAEPVPPAAKPARGREAGRIRELEREVLYTRESLQASLEAVQTTNEELLSTNEELQSTNEELQSTNEELETSKEELQSVNEELVTVNSELQAKIELLSVMQNDMKNLLDSTQIGMIFLDCDLVIRRFTREAGAIFRLAPSDLGRPLSDLRSNLEEEGDLVEQARRVLVSLVPFDRQLHTIDGAWYLLRIRPYRTLDNVVEGVVMTFTDIAAMKALEGPPTEPGP